MTKLNRWSNIFNWLAAIAIAVNLLMIFFYAPNEILMGNVQRIFYFHVGAAWVGAVTLGIALIAGIAYLIRPKRSYDIISLASVEVGVVFVTMTIVAGSVWGRPAWNTWWVWSPRLTSITVMWLVYVAYFMLRGAVEDEQKRARFAAVYVIVAFITVIMTYVSIRLLRDLHPVMFGGAVDGAQAGAEGLQEFNGVDSIGMVITLNVSVAAFSLLYVAWLLNRYRLQLLIDRTAALKAQVIARMQGDSVSEIEMEQMQPAPTD
jgi:heme exporter protein C